MRTTEDDTPASSCRRHDLSSQSQTTDDATADGVQKAESKSLVPCRRCLDILCSSLWTNIPFFVYCLVVATAQGSFHLVIMFLPARSSELGAGPNAAAFLLVLFGAFDMGGRFIFGFIFDIPAVRRRRSYLYTAVTATFAASTTLLAAVDSYLGLAVGSCIVAVLEGGAHSQRATSVDEFVEPSQMSLGVGLVMFVQGFGSFCGPIVGGKYNIRDGIRPAHAPKSSCSDVAARSVARFF